MIPSTSPGYLTGGDVRNGLHVFEAAMENDCYTWKIAAADRRLGSAVA